MDSKSDNSDGDLEEGPRQIKLSNLASSVREQDISDHLREHAKVDMHPMFISLRHHVSNKEKMGFALIRMQSLEEAVKTAQKLLNTKLKGNTCRAEVMDVPFYSPTHRDTESGGKLVVLMNLHYTLGVAEITKMCSEYGTVNDVTRLMSKSGYSRCKCTVHMETEEEARQLFNGLHGVKHKNMQIETYFSLSENRKKKEVGRLAFKSTLSGHSKMEGAKSRRTTMRGRGRGRGRGRIKRE